MRKLNLNAIEANVLFNCLNQGDPQRGLNLQDIRAAIPILDKIEEKVDRTPIGDGERVTFHPVEIKLKESEYSVVKARMEGSTGWLTVTQGRDVIKLLGRVTELPHIADKSDDSDTTQPGKKSGKNR